MINPDLLTDAIVDNLRNISALVTALGDPARIIGFKYAQGADRPYINALLQIPTPGILVAWRGTQWGNFSGSQIWKHKYEINYRGGNTAGQASGNIVTPGYLWWASMHEPVLSDGRNIREITLLSNASLVEGPLVIARQDPDLLDYFVAMMDVPESGDD